MKECVVENIEITLFFDTGHWVVVDLSKVNAILEKKPEEPQQRWLLQIIHRMSRLFYLTIQNVRTSVVTFLSNVNCDVIRLIAQQTRRILDIVIVDITTSPSCLDKNFTNQDRLKKTLAEKMQALSGATAPLYGS